MAKDPRFAAWVASEPEKPHVLLWSQRQNALHIEPAGQMLSSNRQAYREDRPCDFVVVWQGSLAECEVTAENMRGTLEARARAREVA